MNIAARVVGVGVLTCLHVTLHAYAYSEYLASGPHENGRLDWFYADASGYVEQAETLSRRGSFSEAFSDGYRMPAYPLFLSLFYHAFEWPLPAAKFTQITLASLIPAVVFFTLRSITPLERLACSVSSSP